MVKAYKGFRRLTDYRCTYSKCKDRLTPEELAKNQEKERLSGEFLCDHCEKKKGINLAPRAGAEG